MQVPADEPKVGKQDRRFLTNVQRLAMGLPLSGCKGPRGPYGPRTERTKKIQMPPAEARLVEQLEEMFGKWAERGIRSGTDAVGAGDVNALAPPLTYMEADLRFQVDYWQRVMSITGHNLCQAAKLSGMSRANVYRRLAVLNIRHIPDRERHLGNWGDL